MRDRFTAAGDPLYLRVKRNAEKQGVPEEGSLVLAALSGGADSVCMLLLLQELSRERHFALRALHVHHGLRERADEDLLFSRELCERLGIPFTAVYADVPEAMRRDRTGAEEAARKLRHEALERAAKAWEAEKEGKCLIAVGHHLEDQAETVLFHLIRGSALSGLAGMRPVSGRIFRPLFEEERGEIERFLRDAGEEWRTDETNADTRYARNRIRQEIMPLLTQINAGAGRNIARAAEQAAQTEEFLAALTEEAAGRCAGKGSPEEEIDLRAFRREPVILQQRLLYELLARHAGGKKDLTRTHVEALRKLCMETDKGEAELSLPGEVIALRSYDSLRLRKGKPSQEEVPGWPLSPDGYDLQVLPFAGDMGEVPRNQYTKWLDYDKIASFPELRTRREGDRITVTDAGRSKPLARYMIDEKIPRCLRDRLVLPACGHEILWVPGFRINAAYKVSPATTRVLRITWIPGDPGGSSHHCTGSTGSQNGRNH